MTHSEINKFNKYIKNGLADMKWDVRLPANSGVIYQQGKNLPDKLRQALGKKCPTNVVMLKKKCYWVIDAKSGDSNLEDVLKQAQEYAKKINDVKISCPIITGIIENPKGDHDMKTQCYVKGEWQTLSINGHDATGFLSKKQIEQVLKNGKPYLDNYEIDNTLLSKKIKEIDNIFDYGAIEKKNKAQVLACVLLALASKEELLFSNDAPVLINDINGRARAELRKHGKEKFYNEISISASSSVGNEKIKDALIKSINILKDLNIASAINSRYDVLGECFGGFLKYVSDAKEIGIVFTPRIITDFGADIIDIKKTDNVYDPTCGTGGFLVSALNKVRKDNHNSTSFKKSKLRGVEENALIASIAIVNMAFRGDGSVKKGDCFKTKYTKINKVLMNPPFNSKSDYEYRFINHALSCMKKGGLLFTIVPANLMVSSSNKARRVMAWREKMLKKHTLLSVIKMPENLFYPNVNSVTYAVVIKANIRHRIKNKVIWAILHDGVVRTKTQNTQIDNMKKISKSVKNFIASQKIPKYIPEQIDNSVIDQHNKDLSPECYIGKKRQGNMNFNISRVIGDLQQGNHTIHQHKISKMWSHDRCKKFSLSDFFSEIKKGESGCNKKMMRGNLPLISTSEKNNGISEMVCDSVKAKYPPDSITISANGGCCYACYHEYSYAANGDVLVCFLKKKKKFKRRFFLFLCAAINSESWRFNYGRKFTKEQLDNLKIKIPVYKNGKINHRKINEVVKKAQLLNAKKC